MKHKKIQLAIVGYGKMGKIIHQSMDGKRFRLCSIIDPHEPKADYSKLDDRSLQHCQTAICFTQPSTVLEMIDKLLKYNIKIVLATTGWEKDIPEAKKLVAKKDGALIYSSNFSIGVLLYFKIIEQIAKIFNPFDQYQAFGYEIHHTRKLDAPSGTMKTAAKLLSQGLKRQNKLVFGTPTRKLESNELPIGAIRGGDVIGKHNIIFDSPADSILIQHQAKSRSSFASGALQAAIWLQNKKGWFSEQDLINDLLASEQD